MADPTPEDTEAARAVVLAWSKDPAHTFIIPLVAEALAHARERERDKVELTIRRRRDNYQVGVDNEAIALLDDLADRCAKAIVSHWFPWCLGLAL